MGNTYNEGVRITFASSATHERRLVRFNKVSENMKEWAGDTTEAYVTQPFEEKNPIKMGVGAIMAVTSIPFEAPDFFLAGIANEPLKAGSETRTWRDIKKIGSNNVRHPIRTVLSGLRLFGDVPRDGIDVLFGFQHGTRSKMKQVMTGPI